MSALPPCARLPVVAAVLGCFSWFSAKPTTLRAVPAVSATDPYFVLCFPCYRQATKKPDVLVTPGFGSQKRSCGQASQA